jgi:hypothetical protein
MVANKVQIEQQMVSLRSSESWSTGQQAGQRDILKVKCRCLVTVPQQVQGAGNLCNIMQCCRANDRGAMQPNRRRRSQTCASDCPQLWNPLSAASHNYL